MSEQAWTKEPWIVGPETWEGDGAGGVIVDADGAACCVAVVTTWTDRGEPIKAQPIDYANANRIVACVNALAGIDDPAAAIERLVEAAAELMGHVTTRSGLLCPPLDDDTGGYALPPEAWNETRAALAPFMNRGGQ